MVAPLPVRRWIVPLRLSNFRSELPPLLHLALPLIAAELGWVSMSVIDTIMLGHLPNSALAMSSSALAQHLYNTFLFGVAGVLLGLDSLISQSLGAGERLPANRWLVHGLLMALVLAALLIGLFALAPSLLLHLPVDHAILNGAIPAITGLNYGTLPLLLTFALRRYLQAAHHARPIAFGLISANLVNIAGDWLLIFGHRWHLAGHTLAIPAFGVTGSAWSTSFARLYMFATYAGALWWLDRRHNYGIRPMLGNKVSRIIEFQHLRKLFVLGAPAGAAIFVEIAIFAAVTALIATFGRLPLAGHEVALQCASTTFMVPFAISSATAVRVGHAIGRIKIGAATLADATAAGWSGITAGAAFMLVASLVLLTIPTQIARLFTPDPGGIAAATPLLLIAAGFQFFDGIQITATGALRGAGNTTAPFLTQFTAYWLIGMPLAIYLGFHRKMGAAGLWLGLLIALFFAASLMCFFWRRTTHRLHASA
jgi:MATE family multidrug resistance protein